MVNQNDFPNLKIKDGQVFQRQDSMPSIYSTILCHKYWVDKSLKMGFIISEFSHQKVRLGDQAALYGATYSHWKEAAISGGDSSCVNHPSQKGQITDQRNLSLLINQRGALND